MEDRAEYRMASQDSASAPFRVGAVNSALDSALIRSADEQVQRLLNGHHQQVLSSTSPTEVADWSRNATLFLLDRYKQYRNKVGTLGMKNLKRLWVIITEDLNKHFGSNYTPGQTENRWRVLERNYKKIVDNNSRTGRGRKCFEYESQMEDILGKKKNIRPELLLDSSTTVVMPKNDAPISTEVDTSDLDISFSDSMIGTDNRRQQAINPSNIPRPTPTPRNRKIKVNKASVLELIREDKRKFYEDYIKVQNEKAMIAAEKVSIKRSEALEKKRKNDLLEERNRLLAEYLRHNINVPDLR